MILTNSFTVEAPVTQVWSLFDELPQVVPCMPGAAYLGQEGDGHRVAIKLRIGAISSNFQGTVQFLKKDETSHTAVIRGAAKDTGGKGATSATLEARLDAQTPERTLVSVRTDLSMTGRLAQFGGPIIADIAARMINEFADNLHQAVLTRQSRLQEIVPSPTAPTEPDAAYPQSHTGNLQPGAGDDVRGLALGPIVGGLFMKYVFRYVVVALVSFALGWVVGRLS